MYKRILVPRDGAKLAEEALPRAPGAGANRQPAESAHKVTSLFFLAWDVYHLIDDLMVQGLLNEFLRHHPLIFLCLHHQRKRQIM
jgi:hypothetical protein